MGFLAWLFGQREKKFSVSDIKEMQDVFIEKEKRRSGGDFFDQYRKLKEFEREISEEKADEVDRIIAEYTPSASDEGEGVSMEDQIMAQIAPKIINKFFNPAGQPAAGNNSVVQSPPETPAAPTLTDEQAQQYAELIKKKAGKFLPLLNQFSDADILKVRGFLK